ncbi:MAG: DUF1330 domain-containing protein [Methylacidiphilales bacterium]|nr:DUF1330 domain-containing protein [Candidatus Methylacidiphilales bacterium]
MYYLIITAQITDYGKFKSYAVATAEYVAELGGEYIVRAGQTELLEGVFDMGSKVVISRWKSKEHALSFWQSEKYQSVLKPLRENTGTFTVLLIEGAG